MTLPKGKVRIVFQDIPELKQRLEGICARLGITQIDFLRQAIVRTEKEDMANKRRELP